MDFDQSKQFKEFCQNSEKIAEEFYDLIERWAKKDLRLAVVNAINLPLSVILNLILEDKEKALCKLFPELPETFLRFFKPFEKIKDKWGKISNEEFFYLYQKNYKKQFEE